MIPSSKIENHQPQALPLAIAVPVAVGSEQDDSILPSAPPMEYATMTNNINNEEEQTPLQMSAAFLYKGGKAPKNVVNVSVDSNVTEIPDKAFKDCNFLEFITFPLTLKTIGSSAFYGCSSLQSIDIPNSVTQVKRKAFTHSRLLSVTIPPSVTVISEETFAYCSSLANVTAEPNTLTDIQKRAFLGCFALESVEGISPTTRISRKAFTGCRELDPIPKGNYYGKSG